MMPRELLVPEDPPHTTSTLDDLRWSSQTSKLKISPSLRYAEILCRQLIQMLTRVPTPREERRFISVSGSRAFSGRTSRGRLRLSTLWHRLIAYRGLRERAGLCGRAGRANQVASGDAAATPLLASNQIIYSSLFIFEIYSSLSRR